MTRNQVDALRLQETKRANLEQEKLKALGLPAEYLSSIGSVIGGIGKLSGFRRLSSKSGRPIGKSELHI